MKILAKNRINQIKIFLLTFILTFSVLTGICVAACQCTTTSSVGDRLLADSIAQSILRLHVIADSDKDEDQQIKLVIKDALTNEITHYLPKSSTKEETVATLSTHLNDLEKIANRILIDSGFSYTAKAELCYCYFPIKQYGTITLPAGYYDALRIKLGRAEGKNWWCIIFPDLCFVDSTYAVMPKESLAKLSELLTKEEYNAIVSNSKPKVTVRFKLYDWMKSLFHS